MNLLTIASSQACSFDTGSLFYALVAIAALWIAVEIIGSFFKSSDDSCCCAKEEHEAAPCCSGASASSASASSGEEQVHAAVIAAAVATVLGDKRYRISSISYAHEIKSSQAWSQEGRREIYASHRIR